MQEENYSQLIGKKLKEIRNCFNETQQAFGERINCSQRVISNYENEGISDIDEIIRISKCLKVNLLSSTKESQELEEKTLKKIFDFYITKNEKNIIEKFLTFDYLQRNILCGYPKSNLINILKQLSYNGLIEIYKKENDNNMQFILMTSVGILHFDVNSAFPSQYSSEIVTKEEIENEFLKYENEKYKSVYKVMNLEDVIKHVDNKNKKKGDETNNMKIDIQELKDKNNESNNIFLTKNVLIAKNNNNLKNENILLIDNETELNVFEKNILNSNSSLIVFNSPEYLIENTGTVLKEKGYKIKVLNLKNIKCSDSYNPLSYLYEDNDVFKLVDCFLRATNVSGNSYEGSSLQKAERALLSALILYLKENDDIPSKYKNFTNVIKLLRAAEINEADGNVQSPLDLLFAKFRTEKPDSLAAEQYRIFKTCAEESMRTVLISCGIKLTLFNLKDIKDMMKQDNMELDKIRDEKIAIFVINHNIDDTYDVMSKLLYEQLINVISKTNKNNESSIELYINLHSPDSFYNKLELMITNNKNYNIKHVIRIPYIQIVKNAYPVIWEQFFQSFDITIINSPNYQEIDFYRKRYEIPDNIDKTKSLLLINEMQEIVDDKLDVAPMVLKFDFEKEINENKKIQEKIANNIAKEIEEKILSKFYKKNNDDHFMLNQYEIAISMEKELNDIIKNNYLKMEEKIDLLAQVLIRIAQSYWLRYEWKNMKNKEKDFPIISDIFNKNNEIDTVRDALNYIVENYLNKNDD